MLPIERWYEICVGMMKIQPKEFWGMSIKEINVAINGFTEYNSGKKKDSVMTKDRLNELREMYPDY